MRHVYVFGNGNLSFEAFLEHYVTPLGSLSLDETHFIVCDFRGVDTLTMEYLKSRTPCVTVFHIGERPRYLPDKYKTRVSQWQVVGGFESDEARDEAAMTACTHFLAIDQNTSAKRQSGTSRNIERCLALAKLPVNQ
ncbi:MAG: hypothetical protein ACE366_13725 [Bradymonadia bacterium]